MFRLPALMIFLVCALVGQASIVSAQTGTIAFGAVKTDPKAQVEVTADSLAVNQADGSAEFSGNVLIIQGVMRLSADRVLVIYKTDETGKRGIDQMEATGNVLLVSGPDAAESERAQYTIDSGTIVMSGNVLLSQGDSTLTSNRLEVNLTTGTASMAGRVKTILNPDGDN